MKDLFDIKQYIIFLSLLILFTNVVFADNKYPQSLEILQAFEGGQLLYDSTYQISYFIKPNWESSQDVITLWRGIEKSNSIGIPLGNYQIINAVVMPGKLMMLVHDFDKSYLQLYDSTLNMICSSQFPEDLTINPNTLKIRFENDSTLYILYLENFYKINITNNFINILKIATQISDFEIIKQNPPFNLALLENHNDRGILVILDNFLNPLSSINLNIGLINELQQIGNYIIIKSSYQNSNSTLINIFSLNSKKMLTSKYFETDLPNIAFGLDNHNIKIYWISNNKGKYFLNLTIFAIPDNQFTYKQTELPRQIFEPQKLQSDSKNVFICFRNAILISDGNGKINSFDFVELGNKFGENFELLQLNNHLIIHSKYYSEIYKIKSNQFWWLNRFASTLWTYIIPILLFIIAVIFIRLYSKERKLFKEFINFPSIGAIFIINHKGELEIANQNAKDLLSLDQSILLGKPFETYCTVEFAKPIYEFYKHFEEIKESFSQRISLHKPEGTLEYVFNISPEWSITGKFEGAIIIAFNITEEIERKRLSNWAQLAHDMQTNLAIIKLNTEQLRSQGNPESLTLVNRIYNQVLILQKRVRDIVTVGRSSNLEIIQTNSLDLLNEVSSEFDESLFPNVEIAISANEFQIYCDKPKLVRALRNAIENGIKALPGQKGKIEISAYQEGRFTCFSIKDNGKGMDEEVRKKMLTPYFTTSKDGTGFGIGTLIIQEVVELHSGTLDIKSNKSQGTELIIKIPNHLKKLALH
ncbi:MAG TPA: PAS domain-containing sensor histidine kinase [Bacteroidota bacterium]|nr:PAS domain-containing sensor histidine kinase [Bacteroidota bacterium]